MTYILIYLLIGALSFRPMMALDPTVKPKDNKSAVILFVVWCVLWAPSMAIDALFWALENKEQRP